MLGNDPRAERVLVLAPTGRDAPLIGAALGRHGLASLACRDLDCVCREMEAGAGMAVLAEEGLRPAELPCLIESLRQQPPWSDLPLLILTGKGVPSPTSVQRFQALEPAANITQLERPVRIRTLISAVRSALRGRRRQYEVRDYLAERERLLAELHRRAAQLAETDRRKDEFLAMLGHELRNPLAPLRGVMETLQRQKRDADGLERAYAMMDRQVAHLTRLVDDLLDVSRITRGLVELRKGPVNLAEVAEQAVEMATPVVESRAHDLSLALPRTPLRVDGDTTRLTQVVFNLLNNAAKYTDPGGKIWLTVECDGAHAIVRVRDNGTGMAPSLVAKVFDLFTQGERTPDRSQGGLGLGLTLVKRLVEMHGGTVEARSEGPGKGSEFTVSLPALPAEAEKPQPARPVGPPAAVQVGCALVVDDNPDVAEPVTWMLEGLAREIKMVHSGQAALDLVGQWRPDVIICDIGMPGMDGYETCRRLRQVPGLDKTLIAAVSGYGGEEDQRRSKEAGFDRHLVKPIGRAGLEDLVKSAAGR